MNPFNEFQFRRACSAFATGITIVTTADAQGRPFGMTVNSFASVSLEPPLVLWSVGSHARSFRTFSASGHYAVHILHRGQQELATRFASTGDDKFAGLACETGLLGSPILPDFAVCLQCRVVQVHPVGQQNLLVGEVLELDDRGHEDATLYYRGRYWSLG
ncbi:MAG: flavin reductase family protein [Burkholderiaceae bacterium]